MAETLSVVDLSLVLTLGILICGQSTSFAMCLPLAEEFLVLFLGCTGLVHGLFVMFENMQEVVMWLTSVCVTDRQDGSTVQLVGGECPEPGN